MVKIIFSLPFAIGILVGLIISFVYKFYFTEIHVYVWYAVTQIEKVLEIYKSEGTDAVREYVVNNFSDKKVMFWKDRKTCHPDYKLWGAALIYFTHKTASYNHDTSVYNNLNSLIIDYFGDNSWKYRRYLNATDIIFNAVNYYSNDGIPWANEHVTNRGNDVNPLKDHAERELYELTWLIIRSVLW